MKIITNWIALDSKVVVVAVVTNLPNLRPNKDGEWASYIGPVPGEQHASEIEEVARSGTKIPQWMAEKLFPDTARRYVWRS